MTNKRLEHTEECRSGMQRSFIRIAIGVALGVYMLAAAGGANAADIAGSKVVNLGTGFTVPIIDNSGQLSDGISFVAPGPTGNTVYFYDNADIGLALRGYNGADNSFTTISHVGADAGLEAGEILESRTHYFGGGGEDMPANIANYGYVSVPDLYDGVSARFEVNGRQLIAHYDIAVGSTAEAIGLQFEGASAVFLNERNNNIDIVLEPERTLHLHQARVAVGSGEEVLQPFAIGGDGNPELDLTELISSGESISITVKITFGPYYHDYKAVQSHEMIVAASTGFNTAIINGTESSSDVMITRLNSEGDEVVSTTILVGEDEDVAYRVAVSEGGEYENHIYVSGYTRSGEFHADGSPVGGVDAFVLRLNDDGTEVLGGSLIGADGRDVAHDVAISSTGTVVVVGATDGGIDDIQQDEMDFITVFPSVTTGSTAQTYYLTILNAEATEVEREISFGGPEIGLPIRTEYTRDNHILIGVESDDITTTDCNYTSEMSHWFNMPCRSAIEPTDPEWGWHALCWKDAVYNTHSLTLTMPPPNAAATPPHSDVKAADAGKLNSLEAAWYNCSGCPQPDPWGKWQDNRYDNYSPTQSAKIVELAVGAAYYHECCGSPVYANWRLSTSDSPFLIRRVNMKIEDASGNPASLVDICDTELLPNGDAYDHFCLLLHFGQIEFCTMDVVEWSPLLPKQTLYKEATWDVSDLMTWLSPTGVYIGDPPDGPGSTSDNIQEIAHTLQRAVVAPTNVHITTYEGGQLTGRTMENKRIRMMAFHAPGQPAALPTPVKEQTDRLSVTSPFGVLTSHPNPASGEIAVSYQVNDATTLRLELYDAMGRKIDVLDTGHRYPRRYSVSYDTGKLTAGIYYLRLSSEAGVVSLPLTVVR